MVILTILGTLGTLGTLSKLGILCLLLGQFLLGSFLHLADTGDGVVLLRQVDETHTLSGTTHDTYLADIQSDEDTALVDNHQVVLVSHHLDGYQTTGLLGDGEGLHTLGTTSGLTVVLNIRALAIAILTNHHDGLGLRIVDTYHAYNLVVATIETHTDNTR